MLSFVVALTERVFVVSFGFSEIGGVLEIEVIVVMVVDVVVVVGVGCAWVVCRINVGARVDLVLLVIGCSVDACQNGCVQSI